MTELNICLLLSVIWLLNMNDVFVCIWLYLCVSICDLGRTCADWILKYDCWKTTDNILASNKIRAFRYKLEFWKTCICYLNLTASQCLKTFLMGLVETLINVIFQYYMMNVSVFERVHNSLSQNFLNDYCMML